MKLRMRFFFDLLEAFGRSAVCLLGPDPSLDAVDDPWLGLEVGTQAKEVVVAGVAASCFSLTTAA